MEMVDEVMTYLEEWNIVTITVRLVAALGSGGLIGLTRSVKRRGAGFKTHALVCLGSALVMLTGQYIYETFGAVGDIARMAAQVVSGVGFLGVGTIMVTGKSQVKGLTTAAGLWACAGIGIGLGIGFYSGALITTLLVLIIYKYMNKVDEFAYEHAKVIDLYIEFESRRVISEFVLALKADNFKILHLDLNKSKKNKDEIVNATLMLEVNAKMRHDAVIQKISEMDGVNYAEEL